MFMLGFTVKYEVNLISLNIPKPCYIYVFARLGHKISFSLDVFRVLTIFLLLIKLSVKRFIFISNEFFDFLRGLGWGIGCF